MASYILRRLLLMIPTLLGIMVVNFAVIQFAPGGPVEQLIAQITGQAADVTARIGGGGGEIQGNRGNNAGGGEANSKYRGAQGLDPEFIKSLEKQFGFDKPAPERFLLMMRDYLTFNFGQSYFRDRSVISLILEKMPVSISTLTERPARSGGSSAWSSGVSLSGRRWTILTQLPVAFSAGRTDSSEPVAGLKLWTWALKVWPG